MYTAEANLRQSASTEAWPTDIDTFSDLIVNLFFVENAATGEWVIVDAGLISTGAIVAAGEKRFGKYNPPKAIVLTHGHFDHVGTLHGLLQRWNVPVWAHPLEAPYLSGRSSYPPPDPTVGGGMMARLSPLYPRGPIDISDRLELLPMDGTVPPMPGWRWVHTPGHTAGHISLFRESDRALIVGDAFVTTKQESAIGAISKFHSIHGPPMYFTSDWRAARDSVQRLLDLNPEFAFPGHGHPIAGQELRGDLHKLVAYFDDLAMPPNGRYLNEPAVADESGVVSVPPPVTDRFPLIVGGMALAAAAGLMYALNEKKRS